MTVGDGVTSDFQRLVDALLPYLPDVVVVAAGRIASSRGIRLRGLWASSRS